VVDTGFLNVDRNRDRQVPLFGQTDAPRDIRTGLGILLGTFAQARAGLEGKFSTWKPGSVRSDVRAVRSSNLGALYGAQSLAPSQGARMYRTPYCAVKYGANRCDRSRPVLSKDSLGPGFHAAESKDLQRPGGRTICICRANLLFLTPG
jgi:hypothetical protein